MTTASVRVTAAEAAQRAKIALRNAGVPEASAETQVALLVEAETLGVASHGLLRLPRILERIANGATDPAASGALSWRGTSLVDVDGQQGLGPVVAIAALDAICARVGETGIAAAAIRNCDHLGALAFYARRVAARGKVLLGFTLSEALVHPWGGRRAMIGTNPVTIGVPTADRPFVVDLATSRVSMGKIHDHANRGAPIPAGWALDAAGDPTTDATAAKSGAIAPFGEAKGYALGLGFELLVGALTGCALGDAVRGTLDSKIPANKGDLFIVLEPNGRMAGALSLYLDQIRASAPLDPGKPVRVPGDRPDAPDAPHAVEFTLPRQIWESICGHAAV
ncbi:Ldh family oxidoreductase [Acidimangrovimonas sediminis]|uniref:Ldh family oxidoreductase n=1 Tax=Acidimangrovimonas sediminis TaxID=2056283 RepID=UPI000C808BA0|nr:Ldh family oxidoreductase [Acidimangrovimonas sediminis]